MFVCQNLFMAGVDTSSLTVNWAMAELVRNPRVMKKVQDEVRKCVGNKGRVTLDGNKRNSETAPSWPTTYPKRNHVSL